ncbi:MAG: SPOR domain-containing protein, partial [Alphaproteobacteria bacterium]|nr:SPOR domain-containing protein [Alphaproteobacteria bacterium]
SGPAAPKPAPPVAAPKAATSPPPAMKQAMIPPPAAATATGAPRSLAAPAAAPTVAPATSAPKPVVAAPATSGGIVLQIGAYKSQADADTAWKTYKAKHSALLSGYSSDVQQADLGEKGTWYRLRIGGLSNKEVAIGLCDRLKADGGACILGK